MTKRSVFSELMEGVTSMKSHREGKLTLRSYKVEPAPLPEVDSKLIRDTRLYFAARGLEQSAG